MDLSPEEITTRKDTMKHFENYFENTTNTLKYFAEKIGWTIDETSTDVTIFNNNYCTFYQSIGIRYLN